MKIEVINMKTSNKDAEIEVELADTLATLRQKIAEATGEPENDISLHFAGKLLDDRMEETIEAVLGAQPAFIQANFKSTMNINNAAGGARRSSRRGRKASRKSPRKASRKASRKSPRKASRKASRKSRKASRKNRRMYY